MELTQELDLGHQLVNRPAGKYQGVAYQENLPICPESTRWKNLFKASGKVNK